VEHGRRRGLRTEQGWDLGSVQASLRSRSPSGSHTRTHPSNDQWTDRIEGTTAGSTLSHTSHPRSTRPSSLLHVARSATWSLTVFGLEEHDLAGKFDFYYDRFGMADQRRPREDLRP